MRNYVTNCMSITISELKNLGGLGGPEAVKFAC